MPEPSVPRSPATTWRHVLALRLARQHLIGRAAPDDLLAVIGEMVGLHAQVMSSAELQAVARIDGLRATDIRDRREPTPTPRNTALSVFLQAVQLFDGP